MTELLRVILSRMKMMRMKCIMGNSHSESLVFKEGSMEHLDQKECLAYVMGRCRRKACLFLLVSLPFNKGVTLAFLTGMGSLQLHS